MEVVTDLEPHVRTSLTAYWVRYDSEKSTISEREEQLANKTQFFDTGI